MCLGFVTFNNNYSHNLLGNFVEFENMSKQNESERATEVLSMNKKEYLRFAT